MFISGGARSGKSSFAEKKALSVFSELKPLNQNVQLRYIATAKRSDNEMKQRIRFHEQQRSNDWQTIEAPYEISKVLRNASNGDVILMDCLTIWLSNMIFDLHYTSERLLEAVNEWFEIAKNKQLHLIIVSNDLNEGFPHFDEFVNDYIHDLETLHQNIVKKAEYAIQVIAGLPTYWKGER